jgi:hypothetical protein
MDTIRKYAASGYRYDALTARERDALMDEARLMAAAERRAAIRGLFRRVSRAVFAWFSVADGLPQRRKRFSPRNAGDRDAVRRARQGGFATCRRRWKGRRRSPASR